MTNISKIIGWKFNDQQGMRCKEINGVMAIIGFPSGIPSQADQDLWTQEYNDWLNSGAAIEDQIQANTDDILQNDKKFRVMAELIFDTLKAGKTGDYSAFAGMTDKATFRVHVAARFRAMGRME